MASAAAAKDRLVLITGASSGVGLHTAAAFARAGFRTVATMRDLSKRGELDALAAADGLCIAVEPLDVQSQASITGCVERLLINHGKIDVLVNNAGAGPPTKTCGVPWRSTSSASGT